MRGWVVAVPVASRAAVAVIVAASDAAGPMRPSGRSSSLRRRLGADLELVATSLRTHDGRAYPAASAQAMSDATLDSDKRSRTLSYWVKGSGTRGTLAFARMATRHSQLPNRPARASTS